MKLTYMGASYTPSNRTINTIETETELLFLGRRFKRRIPKAVAPRTSSHQLTYRGVSYTG